MGSPATVPVLVIDTATNGQQRFRDRCIVNHEPVTIDVATPNSAVTLLVYNHAEAAWSGCGVGSAGTTGTLTIVP